MGKDAIVHVRIDPDDKAAAEELFADMGTSLSEGIRIFVKQAIRVHGFPFHPTPPLEKGKMVARGRLNVYAHHEMRETEREAWIRSLSDKYATFNR